MSKKYTRTHWAAPAEEQRGYTWESPLSTYKSLGWPLNLWSTVFKKEITEEDLPVDWEQALEYVLNTIGKDYHVDAICRYYRDNETWHGIGNDCGTTRETIRQRATRALELMRQPSRSIFLSYGYQKGLSMLKDEKGVTATPETDDIASLILSERALNGLRRGNILTITQLTRCTEAHLHGLRNIGPKTIEEIKLSLAERGFHLCEPRCTNEDIGSGLSFLNLSRRAENCLRQAGIFNVEQLTQHSTTDLEQLRHLGNHTLQEIVSALNAQGQSLTDEISVLRLGNRSSNCLRRANITTLDQLTSCTEKDLQKLRNMGATSVKEIKDRLAERCLSLKNP